MAELKAGFIANMRALLGEEAGAFFRALEQAPSLALRPHRGMGAAEPFIEAAVPWAEGGFYLRPGARPGASVAHWAGAFYLQEASAMLPAAALKARPGERVLDLCAAPGGKSSQIALAMGGEGALIANEVDAARARVLVANPGASGRDQRRGAERNARAPRRALAGVFRRRARGRALFWRGHVPPRGAKPRGVDGRRPARLREAPGGDTGSRGNAGSPRRAAFVFHLHVQRCGKRGQRGEFPARSRGLCPGGVRPAGAGRVPGRHAAHLAAARARRRPVCRPAAPRGECRKWAGGAGRCGRRRGNPRERVRRGRGRRAAFCARGNEAGRAQAGVGDGSGEPPSAHPAAAIGMWLDALAETRPARRAGKTAPAPDVAALVRELGEYAVSALPVSPRGRAAAPRRPPSLCRAPGRAGTGRPARPLPRPCPPAGRKRPRGAGARPGHGAFAGHGAARGGADGKRSPCLHRRRSPAPARARRDGRWSRTRACPSAGASRPGAC